MTRLLTLMTLLCTAVAGFGADIRHYSIKFDDFHELKVVDGINVDYYCNPSRAGEVEFDSDASVASAVIFTPGKGKLSISIASRDSSYRNLPTVKVYSSNLSYVKNEGDSTVRVISPSSGSKFKAKLIGNGNLVVRNASFTEISAEIALGHGTIMLTGKTTFAKLNITGGAGSIQADDLEANEVSVTINGTGSVACYPVKKLSYGGAGSGKLSYRGDPELKKKLISMIKLIKL